MTITAIEFRTAHEAIQYAEAGGGRAIAWTGRHLVAARAEVEKLEVAGEEFAFLFDHEIPDGTHRIMTVPVND